MRVLGTIIMTMIIAFSTAAFGRAIKDATIEWRAKITGGIVKGTKAVLTGTVDDAGGGKLSGTFEADLQSMTTDNSLRDEHMREKYLDVKTHPKAKLVIEPSTPEAWKGLLTLKGETKPVSGTGKLTPDGKFEAVFTLNLDDFPAIGAPTWKDVMMNKTVEVTVAGQLGSG